MEIRWRFAYGTVCRAAYNFAYCDDGKRANDYQAGNNSQPKATHRHEV